MTTAELKRRLRAMGFDQVDDTTGFRGDLKWRHRSYFGSDYYGSIWVHEDGVLRVNGKRSGAYERTFTHWVPPNAVDTSLRNPFSVWEGPRLEKLIAAMEARITPSTRMPLR